MQKMKTMRRPFAIPDFIAQSGAGPNTLKTYEYQLGLLERWMGKPLGMANEDDVIALKELLRKKRSGPQYATLLRSFYKASKRDDLKELLRIRLRRTRLAPEDVLSVAEVQRMIEAARSLRDRAIIAVLWETGARIHEILALDLSAVKRSENGGRTIYVVWFGTTKVRGEEHVGYIIESAPVLSAWLKAHPDKRPDAPLFMSWEGGRLKNQGAHHVVRGLAKRAGVKKRVYPHLFRHSRATHLLRLGLNEATVNRLMGWTSGSQMIANYGHLADRDTKRTYFAALGLQAEDRMDLGKLDFKEESLAPVVPMNPPSGTVVGTEDVETDEEALVRLLKENPRAAKALHKLVESGT